MADRNQFGVHVGEPDEGPARLLDERTPLHILVLGDFSGRANRRLTEPAAIANRPIVPIDMEHYEERLAQLAPQLVLPLGDSAGPGMAVSFASLDDFHPDRLFEQLEVFAALRQLRRQLQNPKTFDAAAAALRQQAKIAVPTAPAPVAKPPAPVDENPNDVASLGLLPGSQEAAQVQSDIAEIVRGIVAPYVQPKADPLQKVYVASVEEAIAGQMRQVLHQPAFQALEAVWRSVRLLLSRLETGPQLKVFLLDVSREELAADLAAANGNAAATALHKRLIDKGVRVPGTQPWSIVVGNYTFGTSAADVELLTALGTICSLAGGPLLAAAAPEVIGCESLSGTPDHEEWERLEKAAAQRWQALRSSEAASWIGLALPRVLLRLPYGKQHSQVDKFSFEELSAAAEHEAFLWGNPAFACALLLGQAYSQSGWSLRPGEVVDVDELPACIVKVDGEAELVPCAEGWLSENAADAMAARGVMPVLSFRNNSAVRVASFRSLADPPATLAGAWS